ncbi:MAG TPA: hypothetical protein VKE96_29075 [Vicinamibacterales bacterium]|nr:hypothetical protein [Vicinamibacterales bacterium]
MGAITDGSLARHAAVAACLTLFLSTRAAAQPQPLYVPPPSGVEFLSRLDFHLSVDSLSPPKDTPAEQADERFSWDGHVGASFDVVDLVTVRGGVTVDYEAVAGSEYRPFDVNQGNYALEAFVIGRIRQTEVGAMLHHVSRHLSDRPKRDAVAWNELGFRVLHHFDAPAATVDVDGEGGYAVAHAFVDYTWLGELNVFVRHAVTPRIGVFGRGRLQLFGVNEAVAGRGTQTGARIEGGARLGARGGVVELYLGYEHRVDAYPVDREPQHWALAGVRLAGR